MAGKKCMLLTVVCHFPWERYFTILKREESPPKFIFIKLS